MITLLTNTFPIAQLLLSLSLPEITAVVLVMALILAMTLVLAAAVLARKQQNLTLTSNANPMTETTAYRLAMPFTHRPAASTSMYAQPTRPWVGRSSRKGSWFTLAAVLPLNLQKLTMAGKINHGRHR